MSQESLWLYFLEMDGVRIDILFMELYLCRLFFDSIFSILFIFSKFVLSSFIIIHKFFNFNYIHHKYIKSN